MFTDGEGASLAYDFVICCYYQTQRWPRPLLFASVCGYPVTKAANASCDVESLGNSRSKLPSKLPSRESTELRSDQGSLTSVQKDSLFG